LRGVIPTHTRAAKQWPASWIITSSAIPKIAITTPISAYGDGKAVTYAPCTAPSSLRRYQLPLALGVRFVQVVEVGCGCAFHFGKHALDELRDVEEADPPFQESGDRNLVAAL